MIRIPLGNERTAGLEFRSCAPDANPHLLLHALLRTGLEGPLPDPAGAEGKRNRTRFLPDNVHDAIRLIKSRRLAAELLGEDCHGRYVEAKQLVADRCPKEFGPRVKRGEVMFHHEVTSQLPYNLF